MLSVAGDSGSVNPAPADLRTVLRANVRPSTKIVAAFLHVTPNAGNRQICEGCGVALRAVQVARQQLASMGDAHKRAPTAHGCALFNNGDIGADAGTCTGVREQRPGAIAARGVRTGVRRDRERESLIVFNLYPKKMGKLAALRAIRRALDKVSFETLRAAVERFAATAEPKRGTPDWQFVPHPATWFNQGRWSDECDDSVYARGARVRSKPGKFASIGR